MVPRARVAGRFLSALAQSEPSLELLPEPLTKIAVTAGAATSVLKLLDSAAVESLPASS